MYYANYTVRIKPEIFCDATLEIFFPTGSCCESRPQALFGKIGMQALNQPGRLLKQIVPVLKDE